MHAADQEYDIAVVGGGPAGMMAAGRAAQLGKRVVLIEKNRGLGKKLLITGGGRCNVTNAEFDTRKLLAKFKDGGKFLASPFSQWAAEDSIRFFNERGMPTKIEAEKRVFPESNTAQSVYDVLTNFLVSGKVTIMTDAAVKSVQAENGRITGLQLKGGAAVRAKRYIFATGGTSHPETGSTGDGYVWLTALGHTVNSANAALVPLAVKDMRIKRAAGVAIQSAKITVLQNETKQSSLVGKILFTHVGLSGPATLNMSREIGELLKYGDVDIELDLLPSSGYEKVNAALLESFATHANKKIRNALSPLLPPALVPLILEIAEIAEDTPCNSVTREERVKLTKTLKHLRFQVDHLLGMDKAVVTAGGVALTEVDFKTMRSLKCENLYIVGDLLDIDRPSGGYSLQLCWTTGFVAGTAAATAQ
ncbi:MAG: aminoacetone oxidase family FAD-binding enzyme [Candidatus Pacebacteria bacterium]|nr:aminoacetone oxidase family FAD-binding enzyme [Candidatus Paceibacterota bacterium]